MSEFKNPLENPGKSETDPQNATSATGIFGTVAKPSSQGGEDVLASLRRETSGPGSGAGAEPRSAPPASPGPSSDPANASGPGEFTRMLQTLKAPGGSAPGAKPAQELASIFKQVSVERPEQAETPAKPFPASEIPGAGTGSGSGESAVIPTTFTQMFSALSDKPAQQAEAAPTSSWTPVPKAPAPPLQTAAQPPVQTPLQPSAQITNMAPGEPGEFTRLFQSVHGPGRPSTTPATVPPSAPGQPSGAPRTGGPNNQPVVQPASVASDETSGSPGAFTQMFSRPAVPSDVARRDEPGTFTQMFSKPAAGPATPAPLHGSGFPSLRTEPLRAETDFGLGGARPADPALPAQGGFTQLFQALNQEEARPTPPQTPLPPSAPETAAAAGGFTQLLQSLSAPPAHPQAAGIPQAKPPAPPVANLPAANFPAAGEAAFPPRSVPSPPASSGPGEFTRVISGSAFREAQAGAVAAPPSAAAPPAATGRPVIPMPAAMPPMAAPKPPVPAPHLAPPAFAFPPPAAAPPPPAASAPTQSALQKYLPLILLVNVFLLLVIVLILVFVLRHR